MCFVSRSNNGDPHGVIKRIRQGIDGYYGYGS